MAEVIFLVLGIAILYFGGEALVRGSSSMALRAGLTPLSVGLTVVAFGTSAPELVVSVGAAMEAKAAISIGNVVGSNICNIALILAASALIRPLDVQTKIVRIALPILVFVSALLLWLLRDGSLSRIEGLFLVIGLITFTGSTLLLARQSQTNSLSSDNIIAETTESIIKCLALIVLGLALLIVGGNLFVDAAVGLARLFNVSEAIIGLTIVALGTSLPELATSIVAATKGDADIAIGNIVGSNIFNILAVLGISAIVAPLASAGIGRLDLGAMFVLAVLLLPLCRSGWRLSRREGLFLLLCYVSYICWQFTA